VLGAEARGSAAHIPFRGDDFCRGCAHARLVPNHCSNSWNRIFLGLSEPVRRVHGLVGKTASDQSGRAHPWCRLHCDLGLVVVERFHSPAPKDAASKAPIRALSPAHSDRKFHLPARTIPQHVADKIRPESLVSSICLATLSDAPGVAGGRVLSMRDAKAKAANQSTAQDGQRKSPAEAELYDRIRYNTGGYSGGTLRLRSHRSFYYGVLSEPNYK
jgi:hypothetical protein